jgi:hypothetical protein
MNFYVRYFGAEQFIEFQNDLLRNHTTRYEAGKVYKFFSIWENGMKGGPLGWASPVDMKFSEIYIEDLNPLLTIPRRNYVNIQLYGWDTRPNIYAQQLSNWYYNYFLNYIPVNATKDFNLSLFTGKVRSVSGGESSETYYIGLLHFGNDPGYDEIIVY